MQLKSSIMKRSYFQLTLTIFLTLLITKVNCQTKPWQNIGPFMRTINTMAFDYAHPDTVYVAYPQGVYKSVDGAENWFVTSLTDVEINSVIVSQNNPNLLLANSDSTVYKSEDYGETWDIIWQTEKKSIGAIAIDPEDDLSIWIGVDVGMYGYTENLYHSEDGGLSWESVFFSEEEEVKLHIVLAIHFDPSNNNVLYVCGWEDFHQLDGGIFVSDDKGKTWTWTNHTYSHVEAIASTPEDYEPHATYILVNGGICRRLFKSPDYGGSWEKIWVPTFTIEETASDYDYFDYLANVMAIDPEDPKWLYIGAHYKDESSILGYDCEDDSWYSFRGTPLKNPTSLLMHPKVWYMGFRDDGVYRRSVEDDYEWLTKNEGLNDVEIYDFDLYPDYPNKIVAVIDNYIVRTSNAGASWSKKYKSVGSLRVNPQDTNVFFAGDMLASYDFGDPFYCQKSGNRGSSWISYRLFSRDGVEEVSYRMGISDIHIFPSEPDIVMLGVDGGEGCGEGLFRSDDGGRYWSNLYNFGVSTIAMDPVDNSNVFFGTTNLGYVYKSEDWGENGTMISPEGAAAFASDIYDLGVDKNHKVLAATSEGLFRWSDGEEWTLAESFPTTTTTSIIIDNTPAIPVYYVGTRDQGIFVSDDEGVIWESFNNELDNLSITKLMLNHATPKKLFASTPDGGLWKTEVDEYIIPSHTISQTELLLTIYPNPNIGTFKIISEAGTSQKGTLKIVNLLGEVIYMDDMVLSANSAYTVSIRDIVPGNYVLIITTDELSIARQLFIKEL